MFCLETSLGWEWGVSTQRWQVKGQLGWDVIGHYGPNREAVPGGSWNEGRGSPWGGTQRPSGCH